MSLKDYLYYQDDWATIYCGDCREILPGIEGAHLILTDPPYGLNLSSHGQRFKTAQKINGDNSQSLIETVLDWAKDIPLAMFFSPYNFVHTEWRSVLCWVKGEHVGIGGDRETCWKRDFELVGVKNNCALKGQRDSAILRFNAVLPPPSGHVAEKPEPLLKYLIWKMSTVGELVLDPFLGSGTTCVAAKNLNRKSIGIEINPDYCEIAVKRLRQEVFNFSGGKG
jgi:site-specific DNA-methyltransferase (adenine-specific)